MGFFIRQSIKVGPMRFNLSKSGVGVSAGVKGLRVGSGPRGNYVHMGRAGIYYRATLPPATPGIAAIPRPAPQEPIPLATHDPLEEIESASVAQIVDSSSAELLGELDEKRKRIRTWPFWLVGTPLATLVGTLAAGPPWVVIAILIAGTLGCVVAYQRDQLAKTAVVFYELDREMAEAYENLHKWAEALASCCGAWHIEAQGAIHDRKYHAGASNLVRRRPTFIRKAEPPNLETNVETIAMGVGRQALYFFPDRVLIYDRDGVGAVSYSGLRVAVNPTQFIEEGSVPPDARVVAHTWKYVNKNGGPDRRFKDNRQLPICLYDEIHLQSNTGLNEVVQVSRCDLAAGLASAIQHLGSQMPTELSQPSGVALMT